MSEPNSPGESRRGAPRFFVGCEDDESEVLEDSMRTDMELYEDDEDTDSVRDLFSLMYSSTKLPLLAGMTLVEYHIKRIGLFKTESQ